MAELTEDEIRQKEEEEFEFRARAEAEDAARQQAAAAANKPAEGAVSPEGPGVIGNIVGGLQTAGQVAMENAPALAAGAGLYKTAQAVNAYKQGANAKLYGDLLNNYSKLNHDIRQYEKAGKVVPPELLDSRARLGQQIEVAQSKLPGYEKTVKAPTAAAVPEAAPAQPVRVAPAPQAAPTAPAAGAGAVAPEAQAAAQAAKAAAPTAEAAGGILSKIAPYLQTAGRIAAPVARVAGPAGMVASAYEAAPYLKQADIGQRTKSGEVGQMVKSATKMALAMPTPAPLSPQEAKNLLDSGDERTINIYGGRQKLLQMTQPNAVNSGYARQLNILGR